MKKECKSSFIIFFQLNSTWKTIAFSAQQQALNLIQDLQKRHFNKSIIIQREDQLSLSLFFSLFLSSPVQWWCTKWENFARLSSPFAHQDEKEEGMSSYSIKRRIVLKMDPFSFSSVGKSEEEEEEDNDQ